MVGILIVIDTIKLYWVLSILTTLTTGTNPLTRCQIWSNLITSAGVKHPAQNTSLSPLLFEFIMSQFTFTSSAIENISDVQDGKVTITFNGGRDYTYGVQDVEQFVTQLSSVIAEQQSVGRFVNNAIRSEQLVATTAAWWYNMGRRQPLPFHNQHKEPWNFSTPKSFLSLI